MPNRFETAARVRAAIAYSAKSLREVAEQADLSLATLRRVTSTTDPRGADAHELWRIAAACEVPRAWVESSWLSSETPRSRFGAGTTKERIELLEHYVDALLKLSAGADLPVPQPPRPRTRARRASGTKPRQRPEAADGGEASPPRG